MSVSVNQKNLRILETKYIRHCVSIGFELDLLEHLSKDVVLI